VANPAVQRARFLAPGDKLGRHELIRQIAVGGMAELYLARTMGLEGFEKLVVLKRILPQYAGNSSFVTMFLNEARLAATFHHPNIAQVFDIDQDGTDYFFSMEYIHGQDLGHLVASANESGVPISLDAALTLVAGLCAGLHYAHEKVGPDGRPLNVVHRDVSPSNVLVSYEGAVKLVDFGIARAGSNPATTRGGLKGKIAYMSPEQCRGKVALDRRSDVFSIGTILYELTTGRLPFTDETEYGVLNQIVNRDAEPPSHIVAGFSPALDAIVMRALARDPDQRYATALEMQKAIEDFAHDSRLRVSPLVLARLMGTLYPTRLEEWDHARAQGAFFVEQHVVRTLIESAKGTEGPQLDDDAPDPAAAPAPATDNDTTIGPPPTMEPTQVRAYPRPRTPRPLPGMPLQHVSEVAAAPVHRPSSPAIGGGRQPHRPSSPVLGAGQLPRRPSEPTLRAPTPRPEATAPGLEQAPPRFATPAPGRLPSPVPVPGQPGAVPIMMPFDGAPGAAPPMPGAGTLVTSQALLDSSSAPVYPVGGAADVTERVRVPRSPMVSAETVLVKVGRSRTPAILLIAAGLLAAAVAGIIVLSGGNQAVDASKPAAAPSAAPLQAGSAAAPPPAAAEDPAKVRPEAPPAAQTDDPPPAAAEDPTPAEDPAKAKPDDAAKAKPKAAEPVKAPKAAKKPPRTRQTPRGTKQTRVTPKKDPKSKPDPEKEPKWTPDSPFMPVRTKKK
jgi:serine/threonine protein kinase